MQKSIEESIYIHFFLHMNHSKGSLGETVGIFFFWVSKQAV